MEKIKVFDKLNFSKDKDILKIIGNEKIFYSENIVKINQVGKNQERNFLLTNKHVYNFKKKTMKRKIPLTSILGLSYSSVSNEFIIHGKNEQYDYSFISENKLIIICLILLLYQELEDIIMPICEIKEKSLKNYVTYERDKKRNRQITKMNLSFKIDTKSFINNNRKNVENKENVKKREASSENLRLLSYSDFKDFIIMESKIKIENFKIIKEITRDNFGSIYLGKYLKDEKLYLLKSIDKEMLIENNLTDRIILEKNVLQQKEYPFIRKMVFCFQREEKIFFCFNYIKSNTIYHELCLLRFFPEDRVKFYAAIIGLTLEFLHKNQIIYRNFSLKNISITEDGYLLFDKLFNSKLVDQTDSNFIKYCGRSEYLAPEVINGDKISHMSDWWSFGIIIYEMLFGVTPFIADNNMELYNIILNEEIKFLKNNNISVEAKDLLHKLLIKEQNERLGFEGGFDVIKNHYFFKGIDFDNLEKKQIESPFKPSIDDNKYNENNNNEEITINNIDLSQEDLNETRFEILKQNQDKFTEFYE